MSINVQAKTDAYGNIIISLQGQLTFEMNSSLRDSLLDLSKNLSKIPIVVDLKDVQFVGSSGIGHFVETINKINKKRLQIYLLHPAQEFQKVFRLYKLSFYEAVITCDEELPYLKHYLKQNYLSLEAIVD